MRRLAVFMPSLEMLSLFFALIMRKGENFEGGGNVQRTAESQPKFAHLHLQTTETPEPSPTTRRHIESGAAFFRSKFIFIFIFFFSFFPLKKISQSE